MKEKLTVGGQAVIEGVMMKTTSGYSTAVRRKDKKIVIQKVKHVPWVDRVKALNKPVLRGAISLVEMMKVGFGTLMFSAKIFEEEENREKGKETRKSSLS